MFIEMKIYRTYPGQAKAFSDLYVAKGLPVQVSVQGGFLGMYQTEFGDVNDVILMWRHDSVERRREHRAALAQSADWQAFMKEAAPMVIHEENRMMVSSDGADDFIA